MLKLHNGENQYRPLISEDELSDEQVITELQAIKKELASEVTVLGHHYQQDDIIQFSDFTGDSLKLAQDAKRAQSPNIIFCGVHFMAETADILSRDSQKVILPDLNAGCTMADMANLQDVLQAWKYFKETTDEQIIPVTYINCAANLKGFVGENGGSICTSSNARQIISWALKQGQKLLFFPDQHLGRNTCFEMGIPLSDMALYNPSYYHGGLDQEQIRRAKILLWYGHCSVHQGFTKDQVLNIKKDSPKTTVIVHPECNFDVVQAADVYGSTSYIIDTIKAAPPGHKFAVGTEINLVNRLAKQYPDKEIISLSPYQCLCTTMYRIRPRWLLASFRAIKDDRPINIIKVDGDTAHFALIALEKMLSLS